MPSPVTPTCPVRGCSRPLAGTPGGLACAAGHSFDRARSGYVNLLTPQDKRSRAPGDPREAVLARRRTLARGLGAPLLEALVRHAAGARGAVLDVGCGDGHFLAALCARCGLDGWGADVSTPAVDAAARAHPAQHWIAGNADRRLPFADGAFDLALSITARQNPPELRRLLAPDGLLLLVVPAADDLAELRAALLGAALPRDRAAAARARFAPHFALAARETVRARQSLDRPALTDLLASSYRGVRHRARARLDALATPFEVTTAWELLALRPA